MLFFLWFCGVWFLTSTGVVAWTQVCTSDSPCAGQSLTCSDADCILQCLDAGVCQNSKLFCSESALGGCQVRCQALESCAGAEVTSERHTTVECDGEYSCAQMSVSVGSSLRSDELIMDVSCDGSHSCLNSRFELHSEGGAATVQCADLGEAGMETCKDVTVVCHMSASGSCEATAAGPNSCEGGDANQILCANSALCTVDDACFKQLQPTPRISSSDAAVLSFIIANGDLTETDDCVAGVKLRTEEELTDELHACSSLSAAMTKCNDLTQSGALDAWTTDNSLQIDLSTAEVGACEFLFVTFDIRDPVLVASTNKFTIDYSYNWVFEALFYPWEQTRNNLLYSAIETANAALTTTVEVEVTGAFLKLEAVDETVSVKIESLDFVATSTLVETVFNVSNAPSTAFEFTEVSVKNMDFDVYLMTFVETDTVEFFDCAFEGNVANDEDSVVYVEASGETTMDGCRMVDNVIGKGVVRLKESGTLSFTRGFASGNEGVEGGCFYALKSDTFVAHSKFLGNSVTGSGAVLRINKCEQSTIDSCIFDGNHADGSGAVLNANKELTLLVTNCTFTEQTAGAKGGVLYTNNNCDVALEDCVFSKNTALEPGGAVHMENVGTLEMRGCVFSKNIVSDYGAGAVYIADDSILTAIDCSFTENEALEKGGGLYMSGNVDSTLLRCNFTKNAAQIGAAIYGSTDVALFAKDCLFEDHNASQSGGAICNELIDAIDGFAVDLEGCKFIGNSAAVFGGAVFTDGSIRAKTTSISHSQSGSGGAVYTSLFGEFRDVTFDSNDAVEKGGAAYIGSGLICMDCTILSNKSPKGGGFFMEPNTEAVIRRATVMYNEASLGGLIVGKSYVVIVVTDSVLIENFATRGAGVQIAKACSLRSERNQYLNNSCSQRGAGLAFDFQNNVSVIDDVFYGNEAPDGAHLHSDSDAYLEIVNTEFVNGDCVNGGVQISDTTSFLTNVLFSDNSALSTGGALLTRFDAGLTLTNCQFLRNNSTDGGAMAIADSTKSVVKVNGCEFIDNVAENNGGAFIANGRNEKCEFYLANSTYVRNIALGVGGTIALIEENENLIHVTNSQFVGNEAPNGYTAGVYVMDPLGTALIDNCTFAENESFREFNSSAVFIEDIVDFMAVNSTLHRMEGMSVRKAQSVSFVENYFGPQSLMTLLNTHSDTIGSLHMDANGIHSSAELRSFPVEMGFRLVENEADDWSEICPKCRMKMRINGSNMFGEEFQPMEWCDLEKACFDVQMKWVESVDDLLTAYGSNETKVEYYEGNGEFEFYIAPLRKQKTMNLSMKCVEPTDVLHVCDYNKTLSMILPVVGCPGDKYERHVTGGFECEDIGSLSADRYSFIADKNFVWVFVAFGILILLIVLLLWFKERGIIPAFNLLCCNKHVEGAAYLSPLVYGWHCFDFLSDVNLAQSLFRVWKHSKKREYNDSTNWQWLVLALGATIFVAVPFVFNVGVAWKLPSLVRVSAPGNQFAQDFVKNKAKVIIFACLWSGNLYATLQLVNSRILALDTFYMGMTKSQMKEFLRFRVYNVYMENSPQLLIQVLALIKDATDGDASKVSATVMLSFVSSIISATAIVFEHAFATAEVVDEVEFEVKLDTDTIELTVLSRRDHLQFAKNRHRFHSVARALAAKLEMDPSQIEMGFVALKGNGCTIYGEIPADCAKAPLERDLDQDTCQSLWEDIFHIESQVSGKMRLGSVSNPKLTVVKSTDNLFDEDDYGSGLVHVVSDGPRTTGGTEPDFDEDGFKGEGDFDVMSMEEKFNAWIDSCDAMRDEMDEVSDEQFVKCLCEWWTRRDSLYAKGGPVLREPIKDMPISTAPIQLEMADLADDEAAVAAKDAANDSDASDSEFEE